MESFHKIPGRNFIEYSLENLMKRNVSTYKTNFYLYFYIYQIGASTFRPTSNNKKKSFQNQKLKKNNNSNNKNKSKDSSKQKISKNFSSQIKIQLNQQIVNIH